MFWDGSPRTAEELLVLIVILRLLLVGGKEVKGEDVVFIHILTLLPMRIVAHRMSLLIGPNDLQFAAYITPFSCIYSKRLVTCLAYLKIKR